MRFFLFALFFLLSACANDDLDDVKRFTQTTGEELRGKVEPLPEVKPYEGFTYNAYDIPDPFKPRKLQPAGGSGSGIQPDLNRRKEPLEAYPLENLKMVGTLRQDKTIYALIKTPDNNLYRIKAGNYLGQNFGMVTSITDTEIKLNEIIQDGSGEWSERQSTLQLQEEQEQKK